MSFDWKEFLELARVLQGSKGDSYSIEASDRSSVSRAYYAVFCSVRNYAEKQMDFRRTGKAEDHTRLVEHLRNTGRSQMANQLRRLRRWRNRCDYEDSVANLKALVENAISVSDTTLSQL
jgi:uncharacterized protein (UPF0332 family)